MSIVFGFDCTHVNIPHLPPGLHQLAGYTTGAGDVPWTPADWDAHPGAIRIVQDEGLTDRTADVADIERYAGRYIDAPGWYRDAVGHFQAGTRPGQRWPAFYASRSSITPLVNELVSAGIKSGPRLIVAQWGENDAQAKLEIIDASGPFPIVGVQDEDLGLYDRDGWSSEWLTVVSKVPPHLVSFEVVSHWSDGSARSYTA